MFNEILANNTWLWFHFFAGGVLSGVIYWLLDFENQESRQKTAVFGVAAVALLWEVIERFSGVSAYADLKHFLVDAGQDVAGAVLMAIVVVIAIKFGAEKAKKTYQLYFLQKMIDKMHSTKENDDIRMAIINYYSFLLDPEFQAMEEQLYIDHITKK